MVSNIKQLLGPYSLDDLFYSLLFLVSFPAQPFSPARQQLTFPGLSFFPRLTHTGPAWLSNRLSDRCRCPALRACGHHVVPVTPPLLATSPGPLVHAGATMLDTASAPCVVAALDSPQCHVSFLRKEPKN
jgi:hypothetical protein